jgi:MFS family permease
MSPNEAGIVITPLVVFITIGSIANGRIVSRIPNPNLMLYIGFTMLALACIGSAISTRSMPHWLMMLFMVLAGLGLGFVLPNLTVFAQQTAGREHLGIATALLQSLRMIGGMIGTAITGTLVTQMYTSGVRSALDNDHASRWYAQLGDPQILIDHGAQANLLDQLSRAGHNGAALLEAARESLVGAIHLGLGIATVVAVISIWHSRSVPPVKLTRKIEPAVAAD